MNSDNSAEYLNETYFESFLSETRTSEVILFLHGYPADSGSKNRDIALSVHSKTKTDTYLIHYPGLGKSKGQFSFSESLEAAKEFCNYLKGLGYETIHFVGHSWGGFLTLNLNSFWTDSSRVVLMSPFLRIPASDELKRLVHLLYTETKQYLIHLNESEVFGQLEKIRLSGSFSQLQEVVKSTSNPLFFFQATNDNETPIETAREFIKELPKDRLTYQELNSDHSFTDRQTITSLVCKAMAQAFITLAV